MDNIELKKSVINYNIFNKFLNRKHQILDPMATIIKLILLNFYPINTKIYFSNNKIYIDQPHNTQFIERFINGDSRNDISILGNTLYKFVLFYVNKNYKHYDKICLLIKFACMGLKRLQITYFNLNNRITDNSVYTIEYFINYLTNALTNSNIEILSFSHPNHLLDENKLKHIWTEDDIDHAFNHIIKCFVILPGGTYAPLDINDSEYIKYNKMLISFLDIMENTFKNLIVISNCGL